MPGEIAQNRNICKTVHPVAQHFAKLLSNGTSVAFEASYERNDNDQDITLALRRRLSYFGCANDLRRPKTVSMFPAIHVLHTLARSLWDTTEAPGFCALTALRYLF